MAELADFKTTPIGGALMRPLTWLWIIAGCLLGMSLVRADVPPCANVGTSVSAAIAR